MNAPFPMIYSIAQDREDELRKGSFLTHSAGASASTRGLQRRLASALRGMADRIDGDHAYGRARFARPLTK